MADPELPIPGATRSELERVAVRTRNQGVTVAGWRLALESPRGKGAVVVAEVPAGPHYRGEGVCLGLTQEELAQLYAALLPAPAAPIDDSLQLG